MSTVLRTGPNEVAYHSATGRKEVFVIVNKDSARGMVPPNLLWITYEPGQFLLKLVYYPQSLAPDEMYLEGHYYNYQQAQHALRRIKADLEQVVENERIALRRFEAQGFLARLVATLKGKAA